MKKKLTLFLAMVIMLISLCSVSAAAYDRDLLRSITANYNQALSLAGSRSFHGHCNLATAYQLKAMGIYKSDLDYSGSGDSWYDHFKNVSKTSGGYKVSTISGANCLFDLVSRYGDEIYNIVYCLGTGGTSGSNHVLYIRAIIDGYVYFADSFDTAYNRVYYSEGEGTVLSLSRFVSEYKIMNGRAYGCVYFSKDKSEHLIGSSQNPDAWAENDIIYTEGKYLVASSVIKVRKQPNSHADSIASIPNGEKVTVTEIRDSWGKIEADGKTGWIYLPYTQRLSVVTNNSLAIDSLSADKQAVFSGTPVTWTAKVQENANNKYFYSFYIYKDNVKIYSGTFSTSNSISFTLDSKGLYKASVTVMDAENNTSELFSNEVVCVGEEIEIVHGDTDGDGKVTANDARLSMRTTAAMKILTGKNFVCSEDDIKKLTQHDESDQEAQV